MRRLVAAFIMAAVLAVGGTALAKNDNNGGGGGGVPQPAISMDLRECCRIAKEGYLKSVAQPPTLMAIANAAAAVRATLATGQVDKLLQKFWPVP